MNALNFSTLLFLSISFGAFTYCDGQNNSQIVKKSFNGFSPVTPIGDTVLEMDKNIWYVFQDRHNIFWFGTDGQGVYRYDGQTTIHFSTKHGLCNDRIREIKEDKAGHIYFTTLNGISKFDGQKFTKLTVVAGNDPSKWNLEPNDLWFHGEGRMKGPYRYDGKALYSLEFPKHDREDEYYKQYPNTSINPYDIYYIYKDTKGTMWFGTGALGIYRYDGKSVTSLFEEHLTTTESGGSFGIRSIIEDKKGKYWFCNTKYRYNILPGELPAKGKGFINYTKEKGIEIPKGGLLSSDRIYFQSVVEDRTGNMWMQTYLEGIWRYDGKNAIQYLVKDGTKDVKVISMYKDSHGDLWLGTDGTGVYKFNGKTFEKFSTLQQKKQG